MWCCGSDVLKQDGKYRKSVFDKKQIEALKRKFNNVSGDQKFITRETFKKNIGYLGIRAVTSFLDRIFNSFDIDGDNKVKLQSYLGQISLDDFIEYMEILKDGTDDQKAQISFNLIYMDQKVQQVKERRNSFSKNSEHNTFQLQVDKVKRKKMIDVNMFEKFFEDFYKSWSSITNESIPKDTKMALKQFITQLFRKVEGDGRKAIDLEYYKMLYKDRQFMMAFRQINSKLGTFDKIYLRYNITLFLIGNFFIKTTNNEYQKNVTLIHKILKKIITVFEKSFPLMNSAFLQQIDKSKCKSSSSPSYPKNKENTGMDNEDQLIGNDQTVEKYFIDAKRYEMENLFDAGNEEFQNGQNDRDLTFQNLLKRNSKKRTDTFKTNYSPRQNTTMNNNINQQEKLTGSLSLFSRIKQKLKSPQTQTQPSKPLYQTKLQDHVTFLQRKLIFIQTTLKEIIDETKQMYSEMHQQFLKIFQRIEKEHNRKQTEFEEYGNLHSFDHQTMKKGKHDNESNGDKEKQTVKRKDDKKVFFGDKNFNLVLEIMVGIQMAVRSVSGFQEIIFQEPEDFDLKHTFQMDYGHFGQNDILYTFTDYAPNVFNHIRKMYGIGNEDYINSIGPNKMMSSLIMGKMASFEQLVSEGKSGSFFYHTQDGKYLIKTISQKQFYFMRKILQEYFKHVKSNPQTLMPKFFGLHKITETVKKNCQKDNRMTFYLIVMNNFFNTNEKIVDKYDLKGSWVGRQNTTGFGVKKDLNFTKDRRTVDIDVDKKIQLYRLIEKDAEFFARNEIIDYSMLLGFVEYKQSKKSKVPRTHSLFDLGNQYLEYMEQKKQQSPSKQEKDLLNFKFQSEKKHSQFYLLGIIDIFTQYNSRKQAEHLFKSCIYDSKGISAVPPVQYKERFLKYLRVEVFRIEGKLKDIQMIKTPTKEGKKAADKDRWKPISEQEEIEIIYNSDNKGNNQRKLKQQKTMNQ